MCRKKCLRITWFHQIRREIGKLFMRLGRGANMFSGALLLWLRFAQRQIFINTLGLTILQFSFFWMWPDFSLKYCFDCFCCFQTKSWPANKVELNEGHTKYLPFRQDMKRFVRLSSSSSEKALNLLVYIFDG